MIVTLTTIFSIVGGIFFKIWEPRLTSIIKQRYQYEPILATNALTGSSIVQIVAFITAMYGVSNFLVGSINDDGDLVLKGLKFILISIFYILIFEMFFMDFMGLETF